MPDPGREPLHNTHGWRSLADRVQRAVAAGLRIGRIRFLARWMARHLRVPWSALQRVPVEGDFSIEIAGRQIVYRSSLYDAVGRKLFWRGFDDYEPETRRVITERLRGGIFLDVGANTGLLSLAAAASDARATCHAFEPVPAVFAILQQNVNANGLGDRILCRQLAVSETSQSTPLHIPDRNWSSARLGRTGFRGAAGHTLEVASTSLDAYVAAHDLRPVTVIKIDVEGFEHLVLRGARALLATQRPAIVCECLLETRIDDIQRLLRELDYCAFRMDPEAVVPVPAITPDRAGHATNFLFLAA